MPLRRATTALLFALTLGACAGSARPETARAGSDLYEQVFGASRRGSVQALVYVLHRDSAGLVPDAHQSFARTLAEANPSARVAAVLRPGYTDGAGNRSPGAQGGEVGDSYTRDRIAALSDQVAAGRARFPGVPVVLVGDGGGAALAANLAGLRPELVDGMVLTSCPCMLPEWRRNMDKRMPGAGFKVPVESLDPLMTVGGVRSSIKAALLVGADDRDTPPKLSRGYAEALALRGIATDFRVLPSRDRDILFDPEVLAATSRVLAQLTGANPSS